MMRSTLPFRGGGNRNGRLMESALPRLSAGVCRVSHRSVTTTLPVPRLNTCGEGPSMTKIERPAALCPVTTRRICFGIRTLMRRDGVRLEGSIVRFDPGRGDHPAPLLGLLAQIGGGLVRC